MHPILKVFIVNDHREQMSKCTLEPALPSLLQLCDLSIDVLGKGDIQELPKDGIVLSLDGSPLTYDDRDSPIILIDARWKYAKRILRQMETPGITTKRKIIGLRTGYPRKDAPEDALSSLEALFSTLWTFGHYNPAILADYYWRKDFLEGNASRLKELWPRDEAPGLDEV